MIGPDGAVVKTLVFKK